MTDWQTQALVVSALRWKDAKLQYWRALEQHPDGTPRVSAASETFTDAETNLLEAARTWQEQMPDGRG